jgi:hypothetical protein
MKKSGRSIGLILLGSLLVLAGIKGIFEKILFRTAPGGISEVSGITAQAVGALFFIFGIILIVNEIRKTGKNPND